MLVPKRITFDLEFFRHTFTALNNRVGLGNDEISTLQFQMAMNRLFKALGEDRQIVAEKYDLDNSGTIGWWEFVRLWKENDFFIELKLSERIFLTLEDASASLLGLLLRVWGSL